MAMKQMVKLMFSEQDNEIATQISARTGLSRSAAIRMALRLWLETLRKDAARAPEVSR